MRASLFCNQTGETIDDRRDRRPVLNEGGELRERIARTQRIHLSAEHAAEAGRVRIRGLRRRIVTFVKQSVSRHLAESAEIGE